MSTFPKERGKTLHARAPVFYYITDRHQLSSSSAIALLEQIESAVRWGVDYIQLREKDLSDAQLFELTKHAVRLARAGSCKILVNGRLDIALAARAHGLHLPAMGIQPADLKPFLPRGFWLGASTHSLREARRAAAAGVDYILFGPVFRTESKIRYGEPLGLQRLKHVCSVLPVPVIALGGIRPDVISRIVGAGAAGIAGISMFQKDLDHSSREQLLMGCGAPGDA